MILLPPSDAIIVVYMWQAAPSYQLPPGAVVSAALKLRDLVLLDDAILKRKLNFNKRFNQLRDVKRAIAVSVTQVYSWVWAGLQF